MASLSFAATFLIASGAFSFGALTTGWASANSSSDTARAASISTVVCAGNLGGLISTWSYLPFQAPNYYPGNYLNLGTSIGIFVIAAGLLYWMMRQNAAKEQGDHDHYLDGLSPEEVELL